MLYFIFYPIPVSNNKLFGKKSTTGSKTKIAKITSKGATLDPSRTVVFK